MIGKLVERLCVRTRILPAGQNGGPAQGADIAVIKKKENWIAARTNARSQ
jgi:hypothetical protein